MVPEQDLVPLCTRPARSLEPPPLGSGRLSCTRRLRGSHPDCPVPQDSMRVVPPTPGSHVGPVHAATGVQMAAAHTHSLTVPVLQAAVARGPPPRQTPRTGRAHPSGGSREDSFRPFPSSGATGLLGSGPLSAPHSSVSAEAVSSAQTPVLSSHLPRLSLLPPVHRDPRGGGLVGSPGGLGGGDCLWN